MKPVAEEARRRTYTFDEIEALAAKAERHERMFRATGEDRYRNLLSRVEYSAKGLLDYINTLRSHECEFGAGDYCAICGVDSRG